MDTTISRMTCPSNRENPIGHSASENSKPLRERMHCMEVWGGRGDTQTGFSRPGLDVWVWSQNREEPAAGGGELHLVSSCASGRITRLLLADVYAFGTTFRELAQHLREVMRRNVNTIQQQRAVHQMSQHLETAAGDGAFASTLLCTYFSPTRTLSICNAGHPLPFFYSVRSKSWSLLRGSTQMCPADSREDGFLDPRGYQRTKLRLDLGDVVVCCSNSIPECVTESGKTLGVAGLMSRLQELDPNDPGTIPEKLVASIRAENSENLARDHASLIVGLATDSAVPWHDNILAPFRLLRAVQDRTDVDVIY